MSDDTEVRILKKHELADDKYLVLIDRERVECKHIDWFEDKGARADVISITKVGGRPSADVLADMTGDPRERFECDEDLPDFDDLRYGARSSGS